MKARRSDDGCHTEALERGMGHCREENIRVQTTEDKLYEQALERKTS